MEIQLYITHINLFINQARGVLLGPSRVSGSPVSAENIIYEAFYFFWGGWDWMVLVFTAFLEVRGSVEKLLKRLAFTFFLSLLKQRIETPS